MNRYYSSSSTTVLQFLGYRCHWWWHLVKKWPEQYSCASFLSPALETWCVWIEYVFNKHISRWINRKWNPLLCRRPAWIPAVSEAIRGSHFDSSEAGISVLCVRWGAAHGNFCVKSLFPLKAETCFLRWIFYPLSFHIHKVFWAQ